MPKLPRNLPGAELIKILSQEGFVKKRQKGSHVILIKEDEGGKRGCVVPMHSALKVGTLKAILKQAGIGEEEFLKLL